MISNKIVFPDQKIKAKPNFYKNRNIKRDAVLIGDRYVCPLCFQENIKCLTNDVVNVNSINKIQYTSRCNDCGIKIKYIRDVPII